MKTVMSATATWLLMALLLVQSLAFKAFHMPSRRIITHLFGNKYRKFSKGAQDPLEAAMKAEKQRQEREEQGEQLRGTTVPFSVPHRSQSERFKVKRGKKKVKAGAETGADAQDGGSEAESRVVPTLDAIIPADASTFGFVEIGKVLGPHGIKGEVKMRLDTDFTDAHMSEGGQLFVRRPNRRTPRPIQVAQRRTASDGTYLVRFHGVKSRSAASTLHHFSVYIRAEQRPPLTSDEYLIRDLVGAECWDMSEPRGENDGASPATSDKNGRLIGHVVGVVPPDELCNSPTTQAKMHSMLEVCRVGAKDLCLVPLVPDIVSDMQRDPQSNLITRIDILPPAGLLDLTYVETVRMSIRGFLPECATITDQGRAQLYTR